MTEDNPLDEISRIEARLEDLAEVSERCRKIILVSKAAIAGGAAVLLFIMLGSPQLFAAPAPVWGSLQVPGPFYICRCGISCNPQVPLYHPL